MKTKAAIAAALTLGIAIPVMAKTMSVNVSGPGAVNPFFGYQMKYVDKDRNSCTFRFSQPGDGLSYLTADKECPSFVTEDRVFEDAQAALERMETITHAFTFAEYFGDDGYGNKVERAGLRYRCAKASDIKINNPIDWAGTARNPISGYMFMPEDDFDLKGWYKLDYFPNGYKPHQFTVGAWKLSDDRMTITAVDKGRKFSIPYLKTTECAFHPAN
jgi:hypothetical protein